MRPLDQRSARGATYGALDPIQGSGYRVRNNSVLTISLATYQVILMRFTESFVTISAISEQNLQISRRQMLPLAT